MYKDITTLGDYLAYVIQLQRLTQKDAAKLLHISPQTLNNYILNKRLPDLKTFAMIIQTFHLDANRIFYYQSYEDGSMTLSKQELVLLRTFRSLDEKHKKFVNKMLQELPKKSS